ncbi:MAG: SDR family NAD(P)-dependent oxidoreductase, partial [Polyangiaceae bacterium]
MTTKFTPDEIRRCTELLEAIVEDRMLLEGVTVEERTALMMAAGRLSRPTRNEMIRVSKAFRRVNRKKEQNSDRDARAATEIRAARRNAVFVAPQLSAAADAGTSAGELKNPRNCYVCKVLFTRLHFFYDAMCPSCAEFNYKKRFQTASLEGRVALITGARLKIGYQAALMMLRAGAKVIVTTRFPHDAASRYAREADHAEWQHRLQIHGLDLRHSPSVEIFARYLDRTESTLDILINNAAQTVRRPPAFYAHLLDLEQRALQDLPRDAQLLLSAHEECKTALGGTKLLTAGIGKGEWAKVDLAGPGVGIKSPALLSQIPHGYDDEASARELFPVGQVDADLQQVDLRTMNSWRLGLADVATPEMLEVHLVNAVAPFILCSKLKPLMLRRPTNEKHIVNVSAMEGKFSRHTKTDKHPHTNMAKAALNMMTL